MARKLKRIREKIREAEKKLRHLENTWQDDPKYKVTETCPICNTVLEEDDYITNPETGFNNCRFCGNLV